MTAFKRAPYRPKPVAYNHERVITASASRIRISDRNEAERNRTRIAANTAWQEEAWTYLDSIGEIKFGYNLLGAVASRVRLYVGVVVDPDAPPVAVSDAVVTAADDTDSTADDAAEARKEVDFDPDLAKEADEAYREAMGQTNTATFIRTTVLNLLVPGEGYFTWDTKKWAARSTSEVTITQDENHPYQLRRSRGESVGMRYLPEGAVVGRVWREHPRFSMDPDSALLAMRAECEELLLLGRMIRAVTRSRLNAGALYVPDEISVVARTTPEDGTEDSELEADPLEAELLYTVTEPINAENSAASVVPMLLRGPAELADKIKHILFERKSDEFLVARADKVLERILAGLDVPKDVVTGLANVKYSNAIQIDENMYKAHVEPMCVTIADAVTEIILHPTLRDKGWSEEDLAKVVVWYDPSEVVVRPNRSEDADKGYDKYIISGGAWRDAHGFADTDAPGEEELAMRLAVDKAVVPPELATLLFNKLLPEITQAARLQAGADGSVPPELQQMLDGETPTSPLPSDGGALPPPEAPPAPDVPPAEAAPPPEAPPAQEAPQ